MFIVSRIASHGVLCTLWLRVTFGHFCFRMPCITVNHAMVELQTLANVRYITLRCMYMGCIMSRTLLYVQMEFGSSASSAPPCVNHASIPFCLIRLASRRPTRYGQKTGNSRTTEYQRSKQDKNKQKPPQVVS